MMTVPHTQKRPIASGTIRKRGNSGQLYRETCIRMDNETFSEVRTYAQKNGCSFGQACRDLIEIGMETLKEAGSQPKTAEATADQPHTKGRPL